VKRTQVGLVDMLTPAPEARNVSFRNRGFDHYLIVSSIRNTKTDATTMPPGLESTARFAQTMIPAAANILRGNRFDGDVALLIPARRRLQSESRF